MPLQCIVHTLVLLLTEDTHWNTQTSSSENPWILLNWLFVSATSHPLPCCVSFSYLHTVPVFIFFTLYGWLLFSPCAHAVILYSHFHHLNDSSPLHLTTPFSTSHLCIFRFLHISVFNFLGNWVIALFAALSWELWHGRSLIFIDRFSHLTPHQSCLWSQVDREVFQWPLDQLLCSWKHVLFWKFDTFNFTLSLKIFHNHHFWPISYFPLFLQESWDSK